MKNIIGLFSIIFIFTFQTKNAYSCFTGGELTWECTSTAKSNTNSKYIFHLKLYKDCYAYAMGNTQTLFSNSPAGNISMTLVSGWPKEITSQTDSSSGCQLITCSWASLNSPLSGAMEEYNYISAPISLNSIPPVNGWTFYCRGTCRAYIYNNIVHNLGWRVKATMYPYNNQTTNNCYDNSPKFAETPITMMTTKYDATINNHAIDDEYDSLAYSWGIITDESGQALDSSEYYQGYSYTSPFPSSYHDSNNVAATIDNDGIIHFKSYTSGAYIYKTKVAAYKCGILVAEVYREMTIVIKDDTFSTYPYNTPPYLNPPFNNNSTYSTQVYAGDTLNFSLDVSDIQLTSDGQSYQNIKLWASGYQLGDFVELPTPHYSQAYSCLTPPCAILTPANNDTLLSNTILNTNFYWETNCNHVNTVFSDSLCSKNIDNNYKFFINVQDNYCPTPATKTYTLNIEILEKPLLPSPKISCIKVLDNGDIEIKWNTNITDSLASFIKYNLYINNLNSNILVDSIFNINENTDTISNFNANNISQKFFINTVSGCNSNSTAYDTVSTIFLELNENPNNIKLNWNPVRNDNQQHIYKIYKEYPAGNWNLYAQTNNTSFTDPIIYIGDIVRYYIETEDSVYTNSGNYLCNSMSNKASIIATSIEDNELAQNIKVYPNPTSDNVFIEWDNINIHKIELYDINARLINKFEDLDSDNKLKINLQDYAKGGYFVKLYFDDKFHFKKVILK